MNTSGSDIAHPLKATFLITSMETGGAETLLLNLMHRLDPARVIPSLVCLKELGELGEVVAKDFSTHSHLIRHKLDALVLRRLASVFRQESTDALITVGAGDKMFWGRLAARTAGVPVVLSALHSTGWPDNVGRLNRMLTPITDGFIAVAEPHREYLIRQEKFPADRVHLIPNGIDTERFVRNKSAGDAFRDQWQIPRGVPVVGIVAALRPEKNHKLFLTVADAVGSQIPDAHFLIVGDGVERERLESFSGTLGIHSRVRFAGNCTDIPAALSAMDLFSLTSDNEASPVSILEAMSCHLPVVAPRVGSIDRAVLEESTGLLVSAGDGPAFTEAWMRILSSPDWGEKLANAAREHVCAYGSLDAMTSGYMALIESTYHRKISRRGQLVGPAVESHV